VRLRESNARQGFVEPATFEAIAKHLPPVLADVTRFAYATGWRKQEVLTLAWSDVDREHGVVTLRGAVSKNGEPRRLPLTSALAEIIERRWEALTGLILRMGRNLHQGFHELFPPAEKPIAMHRERKARSSS
jgi:integrase